MAFRWIRRWVRRSSRPINQDLAHIWKRRLSLAYGILAWNALAVVGYAMYTGKRDWAQYHGLETDKSRPGRQLSVSPTSGMLITSTFSRLLLTTDGHPKSDSPQIRWLEKDRRIRD